MLEYPLDPVNQSDVVLLFTTLPAWSGIRHDYLSPYSPQGYRSHAQTQPSRTPKGTQPLVSARNLLYNEAGRVESIW